MSSTTTSGLGMSQSPLMNRNFNRQSNKRFSARSIFAQNLQCRESANSSRSSLADSQVSSPRVGHFSRHDLARFSVASERCRYQRSSSSVVIRNVDATKPLKNLEPLCIEPVSVDLVSVSEYDPFVGREWLYHELFEILVSPQIPNGMQGAVIFGQSGTGKTTVCYNLIRHNNYQNEQTCCQLLPGSSTQSYRPLVAQAVLASHFCQIENQNSCVLADFLLNIIAQTTRHPAFTHYHEKLLTFQQELCRREFLIDPVEKFRKLFTNILQDLHRQNKLGLTNSVGLRHLLLLVDGLDEAEFYKPEYGLSIAGFLVQHAHTLMPDFVKLVMTVRSSNLDLLKGALRLHKINLDDTQMDERVFCDSVEYAKMRISDKSSLRKNISSPSFSSGKQLKSQKSIEDNTEAIARFLDHFVPQTAGNFLYMKLVLDLLERGDLLLKGANFKALPLDLAETFLLLMNLKFSMSKAVEKIMPILNVMTASLRTMTADELFSVLNAQYSERYIEQEEFRER